MFKARLKRGVTTQQAVADLDVIVRRLAKAYPQFYPKQFTVRVTGWAESIVGQFQTTLYTLAAAVGLLLLIACSNVANMLLARGAAREREMAIRLSLGASRSRVVRQLLVESLLLASLGALVGCLFAYGGIKGIVLMIPEGRIPREAQIALNFPVLLFSMATAVVTAVVFGLVPALHTARRDMVEPLKSSGKGVGGGFQRSWLRNSLVVAEVSLAMVLLTAAGLLMRSFVNLQNADLGFNPESVVSARVPLPRGQYTTAADKQRFFEAVLARLEALPGVVAATETSTLPPYGGIRSNVEIPGQPVVEQRPAIVQLVSDGYGRTLGLRLIRGRSLSRDDIVDGRRVVVINQTLADRFFKASDGATADPIGHRIKFSLLEGPMGGSVENPVFEIVGVISDAKNQGIVDPIMPEALIPYTITGAFERGVLVRTATDPAAMVNSIRREIWAVDRNVAVSDAGTLVNFLKRFSYAEPRLGLVLMGVFAGLGLVLVAVGVYSLIAYTVSRQTQEIGIRMALGARQVDVLAMVAGMGLRLIAVGLGIGLVASLVATRVLASQLFVTSPRDPITIAIAIAVMLAAGLAACYFPARRAVKVDPMVALRYE
jgi:putative ABC transport system permease protein